ncbi:DUF2059 domain-containing protein [Marinobacter arenosus]|uniref:DUF2059 domain-containing protein n=1 Tax=Marinobacter arenosus TaxID=2856822 RepID=UPI001C4C689E|nr:DUF2059 domain-containing protein [Marinobacter arenosus]MBW0147046.1 DUF2059 domain-containing protein [Marinobacter arenosus]
MKLGTLVKPLLVAGLFAAGPVFAAPSPEQVLAASPVDDIVAQYPAMMSQGIRDGLKRGGQVPPMVAETIGHVVSSSFRAADIEQQIVKDLEANLTDQQLEAVRDWYETPVARKISAAEIAASNPAAWNDIRAKAPELNKQYQGTDRARMFDRFDRAARATESAVDTTIAVQLGLATAMAAFSSDSMHYDQLKQQIESQRSTIRGVVGQQVYDSYLYTYQKIGAQEMGMYMDFLESGPGAAFSRVVTNSIQRAITEPIESVGKQMATFLAPEPANGQ